MKILSKNIFLLFKDCDVGASIVFTEIFDGIFGVGNDCWTSFLPSSWTNFAMCVSVLEGLNQSKIKGKL